MPSGRRAGLTLRSRLLVAVGVVVFVQVVAGLTTVAYVSDELLDQIDEGLVTAAESSSADASDQPTSNGVYRGQFTPEGVLVDEVPTRDRGEILSPPQVTPQLLATSGTDPATVSAERGQLEYRALVTETDTGSLVIYASPLNGYEWTRNRIAWVVAITGLAVLIALGLVTWWVTRLGIAPLNRMTRAAEQIAAGDDLSVRIDYAPAGTEAGELGRALSTMMARIEGSFAQQARTEQRLRQFIADASHELRTPVATIRGYAELYQSGGLADSAERDDAMRRVLQESERMTRLINDLLNLAQLDQQPDLSFAAVDLAAIADDVVSDIAISHREGSIRIDPANSPVLVWGDRDLLQQAVGNIVGNAIAHNPPGTEVLVRCVAEADYCTISVRDDGTGMAPAVVDRVTERFFRGDPARQRDVGGTGLGLSIVASIVAAHQGALDIDSCPGVGTTIEIRLPRQEVVSDSQRTPRKLMKSSDVGFAQSSGEHH